MPMMSKLQFSLRLYFECTIKQLAAEAKYITRLWSILSGNSADNIIAMYC